MSPASDRFFIAGKRLAHPTSGDEVVIAGISGRFPLSANIKQFQHNLFNKTDMVTLNRWNINHEDVPAEGGNLCEVNKFDYSAFPIHPQKAEGMGPLTRNLIEVVFEALYDAGINPIELEGTRTGVFVPTLKTDCQEAMVKHDISPPKEAYAEIHRITSANLISYLLKLNGPSIFLDTACSASLYALEQAYRAVRTGEIDAAIVAGAVMNLHPAGTAECYRQGFLCVDCRCKTFDNRANGYVKSEAVTAIFVQKLKNAKRVYGEIKHCKVNCDGFKEEGISYPSALEQTLLFSDLYEESGLNPANVGYVEAHGTGTIVGDQQEATSIDNALAKEGALLVGSVKSNMGHAEQVAGLCGIAKAVIIMETGLIPPNLHCQMIRQDIEALSVGRLKVPTEIEPFSRNKLLSVNSFGIGGTNSHLVLKANDIIKNEDGSGYPRMVCISGRTYDAVKTILDDITSKLPDVELFALLNNINKSDIPQNRYRGTAIFSNGGVTTAINRCNCKKGDLCLVLGDFNHNILNIGRCILELPLGEATCAKVTKILGYNFAKLLSENQNHRLLSSVVHIVVLDVLKSLGAKVKAVSISPYGIFAEAYSKNVLSFEETIFIASLAAEIDDSANIKQCLNGSEEKNIKLKCIFNNFVKTYKPQEIPLGKTCNLLTVGKVFGVQDESDFLSALSRIYLGGHNLDFNKLYPKPFYPVSHGTPMISPLIKWEHSRDFATPSYNPARIFHKLTRIDTNEARWSALDGHIVNGNKLFPAAGYIYLVWDAIAYKNGMAIAEMSVVLEDVHFLKAIGIPGDGKLEFFISLHCVSGQFTVYESSDVVCTGKVFVKCSSSDNIARNVRLEGDVVVSQNDVYQEFHLRGYTFGTICKNIKKCSTDFRKGLIKWDNNWCAFMDNVLQAYILSIPTRNSLVLSDIQRVTIEPSLQNGFKNSAFSYSIYKSMDTIRCGGVEVTKPNFNVLLKTASNKKPVLEEHKFVPNEANLSIEESVRVNMQIALELNTKNRIKVVEIADANKSILPKVIRSLENDPVVEVDVILLSKDNTAIPHVKAEDSDLESLEEVYMVIGWNMLSPENLKTALSVLIENGYILSRESVLSTIDYSHLNVLTIHTTPSERLVLITASTTTHLYRMLEITNNLNWIKSLHDLLKSDDEVVIYSVNQNTGVLGLSNSLRREGKNIKSLLVCDPQAPTFNFCNDFYNKQLKKGFVSNVFKDGKWGTYRCFPAKAASKVKREHCFVKATMESSDWIVGPLNSKENLKSNEELVHVYYTGLNPKDALIADNGVRSLGEQLLGMEYSGKFPDGKKVMGFAPNGGSLANLIKVDKDLVLEAPQNWTLEEAATVPIAYAVALYALKQINTKKHQNILIHCEADGVGQAAINVGYSMGLNVFATTVSEAKKVSLQETFPQLDAMCIGCSGDAAFERFVKRKTKGNGVDVVLSSLTKDNQKFLAKQGIYLAVNTTNTLEGETLQANFFCKEIEFHCITHNSLFLTEKKHEVMDLLKRALQNEIVKPLKRNVSYESGITNAFKSVANVQNFEKVLIKIRPEDRNVKPSPRLVNGTPKYYPEGSVVVTGGLGGFGMELIDWLVMRGATKVVIASGGTTLSGYETSRLSVWRQRGVEVKVTTEDITTEEGCRVLLGVANNMSPLGGIFHLAAVFCDALFEYQTEESFESTVAVKTQTLQHLDKLTRSLYPSLRDFVIFSSISSWRPNPGQTSYVYANSAMERICECRRKDGLSGIAIQWGIVGDVGTVHNSKEKDLISDISGLMPQSVCSCLEVLDNILTQKPSVISSAVFKEKKTITTSKHSLIDYVANIIGIKDMKTISYNATLAELGMDSITATLIRQKLEREFEIVLSFKELRRQTFAGLEQFMKNT